MIAAATGIPPQTLLALDTPMFDALDAEVEKLAWPPLTELVAQIRDALLGGEASPRPGWIQKATRKAKKLNPLELLEWLESQKRGGGER